MQKPTEQDASIGAAEVPTEAQTSRALDNEPSKQMEDHHSDMQSNLVVDPKEQRIVDLEKQVATLWLAIVDQTKRIGALEAKGEK